VTSAPWERSDAATCSYSARSSRGGRSGIQARGVRYPAHSANSSYGTRRAGGALPAEAKRINAVSDATFYERVAPVRRVRFLLNSGVDAFGRSAGLIPHLL
jgi:hypothetical protein